MIESIEIALITEDVEATYDKAMELESFLVALYMLVADWRAEKRPRPPVNLTISALGKRSPDTCDPLSVAEMA